MNDKEHFAIVEIAFRCLLVGAHSDLKTIRKNALGMCMLPDQQAINLLQNRVPAGMRSFFPKTLPKFNFQHPQGDYRTLLPANRFYISSIMKALRNRQSKEAGKLIGVYSHYLGDFSQPAHHYELEIGRLLPPPRQYVNCEYHRLIEDIPSTIGSIKYHPKPLGTTLDEILFRLDSRFAKLYDRSVAAVIPMTKAIYRNHPEKASKILDGVVGETARLLADVCYTVFSMTQGGFSEHDHVLLQTCDLRELTAHRTDVEFNFSNKVLVDTIRLKDWDCSKPFRQFYRQNRKLVPREVKGICAIPHALPMPGYEMRSMLEYELPKSVFDMFQTEIGLLVDESNQAECRFVVEVDGTPVFQSKPFTYRTAAQAISINIEKAKTLRLVVYTDGSTDKLAFPIWANPSLSKTVP